jgi:hypothetical protein
MVEKKKTGRCGKKRAGLRSFPAEKKMGEAGGFRQLDDQ